MPITELQFINAFIGFCTPSGNEWPTPLVPLKYSVVGVERGLVTTLPGGRDRTVVPEVAFASMLLNHVLCIDAKSRWADVDQERAYESVTPTILVEQYGLSSKYKRSKLSHDVLLVTSAEDAPTLVESLRREGICLPTVHADASRFVIADGSLRKRELHAIFENGIIVCGCKWPTKHVPFTARSSMSEMIGPVTRSIVQMILKSSSFSPDEVAAASLNYWKIYGTEEKRTIRRKVTTIIRQSAAEELHQFIQEEVKGQRWARRGARPKHTKQQEALSKAADDFVSRVEAGLPYRPKQPRLKPVDELSGEHSESGDVGDSHGAGNGFR